MIGRRSLAMGISVVLHAGLLLVLAVTSIRIVQQDRVLLPLVIRDSAPPPPPPGTGGGGEEGTVALAPRAEPPPVSAPPPMVVPKPPVKPLPPRQRVADRPKPAPAAPRPEPTPAVASMPAATDAAAAVGSGVAAGRSGGAARVGTGGGAIGGVPGGVPGGKVGGRIGGTGNEVWRADQVAVPPRPIGRLSLQYPAIARARGQEGVVVVQAVIDRRGSVELDSLRVVQSQPPFDDAALAAFRGWRFQPGRDETGQQVRVLVQQSIRFQLR